MEKIKVIFFATPSIAKTCFEALIDNESFEILSLVTQTPKPQGRGGKIIDSELKLCAIKNNIEVFETERISKDFDLISKLKEMKPDFFITFAFGQILSEEVLEIPKFSTVNVHPSLLPKYRGANPIRACLLNGDKKTGITTALTILALDEGDIASQIEIPLDSKINFPKLVQIIEEKAPQILLDTIIGLWNKTIKPRKQGDIGVSYTKKTKKEDKIIDFNVDANTLNNKIRALLGDFTCHTKFKGKILKVLEASEIEYQGFEKSGSVLQITKSGILTKCRENAIMIEKVKPEGKKEMGAFQWSLGSGIKIGDLFET